MGTKHGKTSVFYKTDATEHGGKTYVFYKTDDTDDSKIWKRVKLRKSVHARQRTSHPFKEITLMTSNGHSFFVQLAVLFKKTDQMDHNTLENIKTSLFYSEK